jgi:DNA polymerase-3 subunit delta
MDGFAFLEKAGNAKLQPVYVLHGDEDFLKRQVVGALRTQVLGAEGDDFGFSSHDGDNVTFTAVHNELETLPFTSSRRLVVVDNADPFVTKYRAALEKYAAAPVSTGILILTVKSLPAHTRLAKLLPSEAAIFCKTPKVERLPAWCIKWAASGQQKKLSEPAAELLVNLLGPDMGQLDQALTKLSIYVGAASKIDVDDVDKLVGSSRAEDTWKIFDAIGKGNMGEALGILDRLFDQGEDSLRILGAFSWNLRRLAQAGRLAQNGQPIHTALAEVGLPSFKARECEQQLRHLGRRRLDKIFDWLIETDLGLKGSSQLPPRTLMERLVVNLARPRA